MSSLVNKKEKSEGEKTNGKATAPKTVSNDAKFRILLKGADLGDGLVATLRDVAQKIGRKPEDVVAMVLRDKEGDIGSIVAAILKSQADAISA